MDKIDPGTTLGIILGASEFPYAPNLDASPAFANSAADFTRYLLSVENGFGIPASNVLNLFDSDNPPSIQDRDISKFLNSRKSNARDIILFYVGHGGFVGAATDYYLALRSTDNTSPGISAFRIVDLARRLK